jgi:Tfp pilus assembly protein PilN
VANFITALKRSGYFQKVEIKESKQDDKNTNVQVFLFSINAEIGSGEPAGTQTKSTSTPSQSAPAAPAKKG